MSQPVWIAACGLVLVAVAAQTLSHASPSQTRAYHRSIREVAQAMPWRIGDWIGTDRPVLPAAVALYRPNVVLHRAFENVSTGEAAHVLFIQCRDAQDVGGHFPPRCYPANGWTLGDRRRTAVAVGDRRVEGTEYVFSMTRFNRSSTVRVFNFMILPDGRTMPDESSMRRAVFERPNRYYGAAQVQVVVRGQMGQSQREMVYETLLGGMRPLIERVGSADLASGGRS